MIRIDCPCCGQKITIKAMKANRVKGKEVLDRFPPTWAEYAGMGFEYVWNHDKEYLLDIVDKVNGKLYENLTKFLESKDA